MTSLDIRMQGQLLGTLTENSPRDMTFSYSDLWLSRSRPTPLSVSFPVDPKSWDGEVVANVLWGLLPDNPVVIARWAREAQCSAGNLMGLLAAYGTDVAGAAQFVMQGAAGDEEEAGSKIAVSDTQIADFLRQARQDSATWRLDDDGRWSLAGAQSKIALHRDPQTQQWFLARGDIPTTHILKPTITGLAHHDLNEHLCMRAASLVGLPSAFTEIARFDELTALVVQRYDRQLVGGTYRRVHQEDFCQALGIHPAQKYENEGGPKLGDMFALLEQVSSDPVVDKFCLLRAAAFNWLMVGTDAHAKNYALLLDGSTVRLAPLYDVASAAPHISHPRKAKLAQKIGGHYGITEISRRCWQRLAQSAGLKPPEVLDCLITMAQRLPDAFEQALTTSNLTPAEQEAGRQIISSIQPWARHCLAVLTAAA